MFDLSFLMEHKWFQLNASHRLFSVISKDTHSYTPSSTVTNYNNETLTEVKRGQQHWPLANESWSTWGPSAGGDQSQTHKHTTRTHKVLQKFSPKHMYNSYSSVFNCDWQVPVPLTRPILPHPIPLINFFGQKWLLIIYRVEIVHPCYMELTVPDFYNHTIMVSNVILHKTKCCLWIII